MKKREGMASQGFCRLYSVVGCLSRIINQIAFTYISVDPVESINCLYINLASDVLLVVIPEVQTSQFTAHYLGYVSWFVKLNLQTGHS